LVSDWEVQTRSVWVWICADACAEDATCAHGMARVYRAVACARIAV